MKDYTAIQTTHRVVFAGSEQWSGVRRLTSVWKKSSKKSSEDVNFEEFIHLSGFAWTSWCAGK